MAEQDLIKAAKGLVDAFNRSDWEGFTAALTPDSVYDEVGTSRRLQGIDQIMPAMEGWKGAMPDVKGTVTNALAAGNTVVLELTWNGTHTGPLPGPGGSIPATGKKQTSRAAWVLEFAGGKVKGSRQYFDMMSFMQQLGLAPG